MTKNAATWCDLPQGFSPWRNVYWYFYKWVADGTLEGIVTKLPLVHRVAQGWPPAHPGDNRCATCALNRNDWPTGRL
ncbi:transposase [Spirosoma aureum]|uniref:Transposase n=1 Tax=Spirosoma aureum TaxID=2692134 RepID=A0A6G9AZ19_9BACT|nr:transposase [Spirosoma aureum]